MRLQPQCSHNGVHIVGHFDGRIGIRSFCDSCRVQLFGLLGRVSRVIGDRQIRVLQLMPCQYTGHAIRSGNHAFFAQLHHAGNGGAIYLVEDEADVAELIGRCAKALT